MKTGSTARVGSRGSLEEAQREAAAHFATSLDREAVRNAKFGGSMRTFASFLVVLSVVVAVGAPASGDDAGFVVIVNSSNPVTSLTRSELSNIFLKQQSAWPDGQVIVPVDQEETSAVRAEFSRVVMKRPIAAVKSYWQKQIFSGAAVPPVEKASSEDVAVYVSTVHGAVGYVGLVAALSSGRAVVKLPAGVKVVRLSD